jgi:hypothetical protein
MVPLQLFKQFHSESCKNPPPNLPAEYDFPTILQIFQEGCTIAIKMATSVVNYVHSKNSKMVSLRVNTIFSLDDEDGAWPLVEWAEPDGTKSMLIFHEASDEIYGGSWLMHSARHASLPATGTWEDSRIDWNVSDIDHLKILFGAIDQIDMVFKWPAAEILKLYCGIGITDEPAEYWSQLPGLIAQTSQARRASIGL